MAWSKTVAKGKEGRRCGGEPSWEVFKGGMEWSNNPLDLGIEETEKYESLQVHGLSQKDSGAIY